VNCLFVQANNLGIQHSAFGAELRWKREIDVREGLTRCRFAIVACSGHFRLRK